MRKSAVTRAARATLSKDLQDDINRWKKVEKSKNKRTQFNMRQLYSEAVLLMPVTWLYSCGEASQTLPGMGGMPIIRVQLGDLVSMIELAEGGLMFVIFYSESGDFLKYW